MRRSSTLHSIDANVSREIASDKYQEVVKVGQNIDAVVTVAADLNEDVSEIDLVAGSITNVNVVGTFIDNVNTVADNIDGDVSTNITVLATDLNLGAGSLIKFVAEHIDGTVSTYVVTVGTDLELGVGSRIKVVADNIDGTVSTDVALIANHIDGTVSTHIGTIGTDLELGASSAIQTVADNIEQVNSFYNTYFGGHVDEAALNVWLASKGLTATDGDLYFDTTANKLRVFGLTVWSNLNELTEDSVNTLRNKIIIDVSNHVHANAVHYKVKATEAITKGQPVYITGYNQGEDALEVALANQATGVATGIAGETMALGEFGTAISNGEIVDMDTSAWAEGTILYVDGVGALTNVEPTTGFSQPIAYVLRSNANNGALQINATYPKQDADDVRYLGTTSVKTQIDSNAAASLAYAIALG